MVHHHLSILGISEMRSSGTGYFTTDNGITVWYLCWVTNSRYKIPDSKPFQNNEPNNAWFQTWVVEDTDGNSLSELHDVTEWLRQYCVDLYLDSQNDQKLVNLVDHKYQPPILQEEVDQALKTIKDGKATVMHQITAVVLKSVEEKACVLIYAKM